jgi:hypothetical protein
MTDVTITLYEVYQTLSRIPKSEIKKGVKESHRAVQSELMGRCMAIIEGIADQDITDERNRHAVERAKKIMASI